MYTNFNLAKIETYFRKNSNFVSFCFSGGIRHYKDKSQWWYPHMMTFSGSNVKYGISTMDLVRSYENNGAAHIIVINNTESAYVRLSRCYYITLNVITSSLESHIHFHINDFKTGKFKKLHYWFFFNEEYNCAVKVDWQKLLKYKKFIRFEIMSGYFRINLSNISGYVSKYSIEDVPPDYLHPINFETQERLFSKRIAGSNTRKVHLSKINGSVVEYRSLKQFYDWLFRCEDVKFAIKNYNSLKSMMSQKKPLVSKCKRYRLTYEKVIDTWVFTMSLESCI